MKFLWHNIILGIIVNIFVAPIAYLLRNKLKKGFLWGFLSDNTYGDTDWRPKLKSKFWRAYLWMLRNPRQNWYWSDYSEGEEHSFIGTGKVKFGNDIISWRTMWCSDTDNWHGKILDFTSPKWGKQDIKFKRGDKDNYRKSTCIPYKVACWIIVVKRRSGHEKGLKQYNFTFPVYSYKNNKEGWEMWKKAKWRNIKL